MKKLLTLFSLFIWLQVEAQVSLSYINHWQLTPNSEDTVGVFCRTFYNANRNKYYTMYTGRIANLPGPNHYYRWHEYDCNFNPTGVQDTLLGFMHGGDYAIEKVGNHYYHLTGVFPWNFKLSKFDEDFNLVNAVTFPMDSSDSQADMMLNYTNGRFIIGAFHQDSVLHPNMPMQQASWSPYMHKWEYDTNLVQLAPPVFLNETFDPWGSSCIFNNNQYNIITMYKWPQYKLNVYRYDNAWNYIDSVNLNNDGQWSQGVLWDGNYYYVAYHSGHEHRSGNITVGIYDINWALVYDTTITNNEVFVFGSSPPLATLEHNANRPQLTKVGDTLVVSYDVDEYVLNAYAPFALYAEGNKWQAHVMKLKINGLVGLENDKEKPIFNIFPNPSSDLVNIYSSKKGIIELYNVWGEKIFDQKMDEGNTQMNIETYPSGIYFIRLITMDGYSQRKLMIEH